MRSYLPVLFDVEIRFWVQHNWCPQLCSVIFHRLFFEMMWLTGKSTPTTTASIHALSDLGDEQIWIRERISLAGNQDVGRSLLAVNQLIRRHRLLLKEVAVRDERVELLLKVSWCVSVISTRSKYLLFAVIRTMTALHFLSKCTKCAL